MFLLLPCPPPVPSSRALLPCPPPDGLRGPMYAAAAVGVLNFLIILLLTPESLPPSQRRGKALDWKEANPLGALSLLFRRSPLLRGSSTAFFLLWLGECRIPVPPAAGLL
jgi:hypothetical protein